MHVFSGFNDYCSVFVIAQIGELAFFLMVFRTGILRFDFVVKCLHFLIGQCLAVHTGNSHISCKAGFYHTATAQVTSQGDEGRTAYIGTSQSTAGFKRLHQLSVHINLGAVVLTVHDAYNVCPLLEFGCATPGVMITASDVRLVTPFAVVEQHTCTSRLLETH